VTKMYPSQNIAAKPAYDRILGPFRKDLMLVEDAIQSNFRSDVAIIPKISNYLMDSGGKRIRPLLVLIVSKLLGYEAPADKEDPRINYSVVAEYIHAAALLHDDVVDEGNFRRNKLSCNREYGNQASILVGDYLFARAYEILASAPDIEVVSAMTIATRVMAEGEVLQLTNSFSLKNTEELYLETIYRKTAVLISACCKVGAMLGKGTEEQIKSIASYGYNIGMAFQLLDDVLDYVATDDKWGKPIGVDLAEGKVTLPLIWAYSQAEANDKTFIEKSLEADEVSSEMFEKTLHIIRQTGGLDRTYSKAQEYSEMAKYDLNMFESSSQLDGLFAIADYIVDRSI